MADAVRALTHWRRGREVVRAEHTKEVVREALPEAAKLAIAKLATALDESHARIDRLERIIAALAKEVAS